LDVGALDREVCLLAEIVMDQNRVIAADGIAQRCHGLSGLYC
jgi:hypothetical protein